MNDLESEWEQMTPHWIKEMREGRNATREIQLDPPILDLCGDVTDKDVVDLGCGEGRFSRKLGAQGATVLGLDRSRTMIEAAMSIAGPAEEYRVADVQNLSFLEDASFDLAISYLNQCDLPDFAANTKEVFRILKPGGVFVIANLHPMRSATGLWCKDESGKKLHVTVDNYLESEKRHWKIMGVTITNFHRSLETYVMAYLDAGFKLERIEEPSVSNEALEQYPELDDEQRVPNFILFKLRR
ncbi:MAG: class I SAM-dependent methyltransferase [Pyrinomonadaceae bacterium]|nr:class I SAM-dependent methyltransferase [Pyrinomonadaceae bacterium]